MIIAQSFLDGLARLDLLRSRFLRHLFLLMPFLKTIFIVTEFRQIFIFCGMGLIYFGLSLTVPVLMMVFSPLILGVPHLVTSFRYSNLSNQLVSAKPKGNRRVDIFLLTASVLFSIVIWQFPDKYSSSAVLGYVICFVGLAMLGAFQSNLAINIWTKLVRTVPFFVFIMFLAYLDLQFIAWVSIAHNFIAFYFWYNSQKGKRWPVYAGLALFILAHLVVLTGVCDLWIDTSTSFFSNWLATNSHYVDGIVMSAVKNWIDLNLANSEQLAFWNRIVVLFVFGQAIHYLLWLKMIPENNSPRTLPKSFQATRRFYIKNYGSALILAIVALYFLPIAVALIYEPMAGLTVYLILAGFHGIQEICQIFVAIFFTSDTISE